MTSSCTAPACIVEWGINDQYVIQWGILPRTIYCFVAHCFCNMCLILAILFKVVACFDVTKYILIASEIPEVARSHILSSTGWQWFYCDFFWLKKNKPASWCGSLWFYTTRFYFVPFPKWATAEHDDGHGNDPRINGLSMRSSCHNNAKRWCFRCY